MMVPLTRPASEFQLTGSWIMKVFGTVVRSDAAKSRRAAVLVSNAYLLARHQFQPVHFPVGSLKSQYLSTNAWGRFCFRHRTLRINSEAGCHAPSPLGATSRTPFSP